MQQQQEQEAVTHGSESLDGEKTSGQDHAPCPTAQKDGNLADEVSVYLFFLYLSDLGFLLFFSFSNPKSHGITFFVFELDHSQ